MVLEDGRVTVKEMSIQMEIWEESVCKILKRFGVEKNLCKLGSEDFDRCPQRNLKKTVCGEHFVQ
jgi:phosphosulfolactate phosphohydrolase-like enzyme